MRALVKELVPEPSYSWFIAALSTNLRYDRAKPNTARTAAHLIPTCISSPEHFKSDTVPPDALLNWQLLFVSKLLIHILTLFFFHIPTHRLNCPSTNPNH